MTTFWGMSITRRILGASGILSALLGLNACQTTSTVNTGDSKNVSFTANLSPDRIPDSISWSFNGKSGRGSIVLLDASKLSYRFDFTLSEPPGSKPYDVTFWRLSIQLARLQVANGVYEQPTWRDTLGLVLLKRLDSLRATKDSASYPESVKSLIEIYATALIDGDTLFKGFPARTVTTLDTAAIYRAAIIQAAKRHQPYSILAASWGLGLDSLATYNRLAKLVSANGPITPADSLAFFPPYPVRVGKALSVASLSIGGESVPVNGSFVGDSGLSSYKVRILKGTDDKSDLFNITTQPTQLDGSQTAWDLATNARLTLQVKTAEVGSYTLEVSITDPKGRSEASRAEFSVLPPPDKTGPNIEWVSPKSNAILENKDSLLVVKVRATDLSGVDSVHVNGLKATLVDSFWSQAVNVPVSDSGYSIHVESWDSKSNKTTSTVSVVRKNAYIAGAPIVDLLVPESNDDNSLPFEVDSIRVSWIIKDPSGVNANSVAISGGSVVRESDSVWSSVIRVPPTGMPHIITLQVKNLAGNQSTDYVVVTRQKDQIGPQISIVDGFGTRELPYDSLAGFVQWRISDNHKISKITINDSVIEGETMLFGMLLSLNVGANVASVIAEDSTGNRSTSNVTLTRKADTTKPRVLRVTDHSGKIFRWNDSSITVSWSVFEDGPKLSVLIQGDTVKGDAGVFTKKVTLKVGENHFVIKAVDRAGNLSQDTVKVTRSRPLVRSISTRGGRTLAVLDDGSVRLWGDSYRTSLVVPDSVKNCIKVSTGGTHYVAIRADSTLLLWGANTWSMLAAPADLGKVVAIAAGNEHTVVLQANGNVRAWGRNIEGQSDVPSTLSDVIDVAAGVNFSAAITRDGSVHVWGDTSSGIGNVPQINNAQKIVAGNRHLLVLKADGSISAWGDNSYGQCVVPQKANLVKRIAAGAFHSIAILQDGTIAAWGRNDEKQLDIPQGLFNVADVSAGNFYSIAVQNDGTLRGWGSNSADQIKFPEDLIAP